MQFIKLELGALAVMAFLLWQFFQTKRPPTTPNRILRSLLIAAVANLMLQATANLMVNYQNRLPGWLVRSANQLFYLSLCVFLFLGCYYLLALVQTRNLLAGNTQLLLLAPLLCAAVLVFSVPLYYKSALSGSYAYGPMGYIYQFAVLFYLGFGGWHLWKNRGNTESTRRDPFFIIMLISMLLAILQFFLPALQLSGVSVVLLSLCSIMLLEPPGEFLTQSCMFYNRKGFDAVANDMMLRGKKVTTVFVVYREFTQMQDRLGEDSIQMLYAQLEEYLQQVFRLSLYLPLEGCAAVFVEDDTKVETVIFGLQQRFESSWNIFGVSVGADASVVSFVMPEPFSTTEALLNSVLEEADTAEKPVFFIDHKLGIKNRKAFDRALLMLHQNRKAHSSIYYLEADIVGMHKINQTHGIHAGDVVLKDCADLLTKAVGEGIEVYRVGGDSFGILLLAVTDKDLRDLLDRIQDLREQCNKDRGQIPIEISVGYSRYYEDSDKTFASMVSRAEFQMNNQKKHQMQETNLYNVTRLGTKLFK